MTDRKAFENVEDIYPLTPMQHRTMLDAVHRPDSIAYFEQFTFLIRGPLDVDAYQQAWQKTIDRHAALRAQFVWQEHERPLSIIMKRATMPWTNVDWSNDSAPELEAFLNADRARLFKLNRAPLMRMTLARLDAHLHRVIWSFHHILVDGWSVSTILQDVNSIYESLITHRPVDLPPAGQLRDVVGAIAKLSNAEAEAHWRRILAEVDSASPLLATRDEEDQRGRVLDPQVAKATLSPGEYDQIREFARSNRLTLAALMLGAWALVQSRYVRSDDVVFGTTFSGRSLAVPGIERIVGLLMNAAPVRIRMNPDDTIGSFLTGVHRHLGESSAHEQTPLTDAQRWSGIPPRSPMFNSIVVFGNYPLDDARAGRGSTISIESSRSLGWTDVPLTLMVSPTAAFEIEARYDTSVVNPVLVRQMLDDVVRTMLRLASDPARSLDSVEITDDDSRQRLLKLGSGEQVTESTATIHGLMLEQARRTPNAPAYCMGSAKMTYADLDRRSRAIAHRLISEGVEVGTPIAVCLNPGFDLPAAMLGVLRAGCCYVPLDPTYPTARLAYVLSDASPPFVLTTGQAAASLPSSDATTIDLSTIVPSDEPLDVLRAEPTVAYVTYTSGSTGHPKGVRGTHRGAVNRFRWMWATKPFTAGEVTAWGTTINFVDHVWEAFGPLCAGVPIEILPHETVKEPRALVAAWRRARVSRIVVVPALLEAVLDAHDDLHKRLAHLRVCVSSGEALSWERATRFREALPKVELINLYGSSEIAADVTHAAVNDIDTGRRSIPIGRPIHNTRVLLLDHRKHIAPPGVPGEIHIAGDALADGYHQRADLTAERFIEVSIDGQEPERVFATGDLAVWNDRGELEYLGRADNQIKIRGFRVELGEVEHTIALHPGVTDAAVVCRDSTGGSVLHGYVVGNGEQVDLADLRRFVRSRLPDYMLPSAFVALDGLPRTPNGKVDRGALPMPAYESTTEVATDEATQRIVEIFGEVLGRPAVGPGQCFFDLGGHSLLAVKLAARLENEFGKPFALATLLHASTPLALRETIQGQEPCTDDSVVVTLRGEGTRLPLFFIHGMDGNILFLDRLAGALSPSQPLYGIAAVGVDGRSSPLTSIESMADHYASAILAVRPTGPFVVGGYSLGGTIALEVAHRLAARGHEVARVVMLDTRVPRAMGGRSLRQTMLQRASYHLRSGPRAFLRTIYIGPIERNAYRVIAKLGLPMPSRLAPWPVRFANLRAYFRYRPRPWGGAISLLRAEHQEDEYKDLPALGWEHFARGELSVHPLACDHLNFFSPTSAGVLAAELDRILASTTAAFALDHPEPASSTTVNEPKPEQVAL